jgi:hypothetical protein
MNEERKPSRGEIIKRLDVKIKFITDLIWTVHKNDVPEWGKELQFFIDIKSLIEQSGKPDTEGEKPDSQWEVETLARKFHEIYQVEAKRQGDVRHPDGYDSLPENIKEYDRVLARYVLQSQKPDRQGDECRRLAQEIFDGLLGGGMCEFDVADKIQALLHELNEEA